MSDEARLLEKLQRIEALHRQRANTVMVRVPRSFVSTLWPEYRALNEALRDHLDAVAERVISQAIAGDTSEAEEVRGEIGAGASEVEGDDAERGPTKGSG
jgi:fumarylacetoacetate (FAA) hydrolase family protein